MNYLGVVLVAAITSLQLSALLALPEASINIDVVAVDGPAQIDLRVRDDMGNPLAARVQLHGQSGTLGKIDLAGYNLAADDAFFVDGQVAGKLPAGEYSFNVSIGHGQEYIPYSGKLNIRNDHAYTVTVTLPQWFDPNAEGWYSADFHLHSYRHGRLKLLADEPIIETEFTRRGADRVDYALVALAGRTSGLNLTVDNKDHRILMSHEVTSQLEEAHSTPKALLMISSEVKLDPMGHVNVPGTSPGLHPRTEPSGFFPIGMLLEQARKEGGEVVYTHPLRTPWFNRMSALEMYSHLVLENHGALFDIGPATKDLVRVQIFGLWNAGVRIGAGSTSDSPVHAVLGEQRTYIRAPELSAETILEGLRKHNTIGVDGPVFARIAIGDAGPGDTVSMGDHSMRIQAHALNGLDSIEVIVDGAVVATFPGDGKHQFDATAPITLKPGGYVSIIARDSTRSGIAIPTAIFAEGRPYNDKYSTLLFLSELNRRTITTGEYFLHLMATVNPEDAMETIVIYKDGEAVEIIAAGQDYPANADFLPIWPCARRPDHQKSWAFWDDNGAVRHVQLSWPINANGSYSAVIRTRNGVEIDAGTIDFHKTSESWQGGVIQLFGSMGQSSVIMGGSSNEQIRGERNPASRAWNTFNQAITTGKAEQVMQTASNIKGFPHPSKVLPGSIGGLQ